MAQSSVANSPIEPGEPDRPPPKLVLASEALREDLAPKFPGATVGRRALFGLSAAFALLAASLSLGGVSTHEPAFLVSAGAGIAVGAIAALPLSYARRAILAICVGVAVIGMGIAGLGPLAVGTNAGIADVVTRLLALGLLPAALLFRAHYRAYAPARRVLAFAFICCFPFVATRSLVLVDPAAPLLYRGSAFLDLAVILCGLFGFMGEETTGGGSVWAAIVLFVLPADAVLTQLDRSYLHGHARGALARGILAHSSAAVGTACAATLVSLGAYHALSAWLGSDARKCARAKATPERIEGRPEGRPTSPA